MKTKLIHITDLSGKDKYYFCFENGNEITQQEINRIEYFELKSAEEKHFNESVNRLKNKYEL